MVYVKIFIFFVFGLIISGLIAFWGFKNNFPGKSISRAIQQHLKQQTGMSFEIKDLELGWKKMTANEISIYSPKWFSKETERKMLLIEEIDLPFSTILSSGELILKGKAHGGNIKFVNEIFSQNGINIFIEGVRIEQIPLINLTKYNSIKGVLSLTASIKNFEDLQKNLTNIPEGDIKGRLKNTNFFFYDGSKIFGFEFPELNFSEIIFDINLGTLTHINKIQFKGSLEGTINGTTKINSNNPKLSIFDLNIKIIPSSNIKKKLLTFSPIISPFQCGETINVNVKGSLNRIKFPKRNKC